ncbi:endo-1,4-beta-xylanase [Haladaptatus halobius]|uniref:endo-1,4-beta-xylanase n=1 Tax=Haladaptatus halobius TaxID=2884875 RepID=UPI001D0B7FE8
MLEGLNLYAGHSADLRITEFDMSNENWTDKDKADFLYQFLKMVYSRPTTTDFLMWGFWDGRHWQGQAPLFDED